MRHAFTVGVLGLALAGCGESAEQAVEGMGSQIELGRKAQADVILAQMRKQLGAFKAAHGRTPESLDELGEKIGWRIPEPPRGLYWDYDPDTGRVTAAKVP